MREAQAKSNNARILYDAGAAAYALNDWFDPERLAEHGWLKGSAMGRARAHVFCYEGNDYVLRHYRRGGKAVLFDDRYLWTGIDRTRAWREWRLLAKLVALGLPAPRPFAARVIRHGLIYRADLITLQCPDTLSLAQRLAAGALPDGEWRKVGHVIAQFHNACVWHADLNAHNVLLNAEGAVILVDFDRARIRRTVTRWRESNLARLLRSLQKLKRLNANLSFRESDFELVRDGYDSYGA